MACIVFAVSFVHLKSVAAQIDESGVIWATPYDGESWTGIRATAEFVGKNVPPDKIVFSESDPLIYLLSGRKSIWYFQMMPFQHFYGDNPDQGVRFLDVNRVDTERPSCIVNIHNPGFPPSDAIRKHLDHAVSGSRPASVTYSSPSGLSRVVLLE